MISWDVQSVEGADIALPRLISGTFLVLNSQILDLEPGSN